MYILDGTPIKRPNSMEEGNSTQTAQLRALNGTVSRDLFGSNKRVWRLEYVNTQKTYYDVIKTIYDAYLSTGDIKTWEVDETNYSFTETEVHVDLVERSFSVKGDSYLSDFTLTLTEA